MQGPSHNAKRGLSDTGRRASRASKSKRASLDGSSIDATQAPLRSEEVNASLELRERWAYLFMLLSVLSQDPSRDTVQFALERPLRSTNSTGMVSQTELFAGDCVVVTFASYIAFSPTLDDSDPLSPPIPMSHPLRDLAPNGFEEVVRVRLPATDKEFTVKLRDLVSANSSLRTCVRVAGSTEGSFSDTFGGKGQLTMKQRVARAGAGGGCNCPFANAKSTSKSKQHGDYCCRNNAVKFCLQLQDFTAKNMDKESLYTVGTAGAMKPCLSANDTPPVKEEISYGGETANKAATRSTVFREQVKSRASPAALRECGAEIARAFEHNIPDVLGQDGAGLGKNNPIKDTASWSLADASTAALGVGGALWKFVRALCTRRGDSVKAQRKKMQRGVLHVLALMR